MLYTANVFLFQGSESPHFISKNLLQFGQFCMPNELNWCHEPQRTSVEGTSVITGPKCNKGPICNNIWTQA